MDAAFFPPSSPFIPSQSLLTHSLLNGQWPSLLLLPHLCLAATTLTMATTATVAAVGTAAHTGMRSEPTLHQELDLEHAAECRASGMATETRPLNALNNQTTTSFHQPRAPSNTSDRLKTSQEYRARLVRLIPSESGCSSIQIPLNITIMSPSRSCTP